jgi:alkanesulfonate monooxygenase SsuD/methylene tetrahydromethanopterin reductase-like flavin-dependent oxidoreductase (luciferase family)
VQLASLRQGLAKSGRTLRDFDMPAMIVTITGRNDEEIAAADFAMRKLLAFYGSTPAYYSVLELHGWGDLGPRLNQMSKEGKWVEMADSFTEEMVQQFAVKGRPEQIPDLIAERCKGLIDRVTLYAPYASDASIWPDIVRGIQAKEGKTVFE